MAAAAQGIGHLRRRVAATRARRGRATEQCRAGSVSRVVPRGATASVRSRRHRQGIRVSAAGSRPAAITAPATGTGPLLAPGLVAMVRDTRATEDSREERVHVRSWICGNQSRGARLTEGTDAPVTAADIPDRAMAAVDTRVRVIARHAATAAAEGALTEVEAATTAVVGAATSAAVAVVIRAVVEATGAVVIASLLPGRIKGRL